MISNNYTIKQAKTNAVNTKQSLLMSAGWINQARKVYSPNYNNRPDNTKIDAIIIHGISLPIGKFKKTYIDDLFTNQLDTDQHASFTSLKNLKVSAHFLIRRDGELVQYVSTNDRAWHAGKSSLAGVRNCNNFSIGIELEGSDNIAYEQSQYQQLVSLVHCLKQNYPDIDNNRIVGHSDIAPGRKTDPGDSFIWADFFERLKSKERHLK